MKNKLIGLMVCSVLLIGAAGCGSKANEDGPTSNSGSNSQSLYKTMTIKELNDETDKDGNAYLNYTNKKIKVTNLKVSEGKLFAAETLVTVTLSCRNINSLDVKPGETVSVTGVVDPSSIKYTYFLNDCTVEK